ncbi:MAG TPA: hypothetical protein VHO06_27640 [Polyangia bacterium]|nr:hypothetical protein [Polyangia bacterium]
MRHGRWDRGVLIAVFSSAAAAAGCGGTPAAEARRPDAGGGLDAPVVVEDAGPVDASVVDVGIGPWTGPPDAAPPVPLDDVTVYAFSQVDDPDPDPQVIALAPDMSIRNWARWDRYGTLADEDYDFSYVASAHAAGVKFIGGTTATVLFQDEFPNPQFPSTNYRDVATLDATGALVFQGGSFYRGSLADPTYRDYLIQFSEAQIDGGVDGLFFDELGADYDGSTYNGNGGFDDYHLADFNAYLLWRYPGADYATMFGMTPDNLLKADVPAGDLVHNFNYRKYLATYRLGENPLDPANLLLPSWGNTSPGNRPAPGAADFVDSAEPYRYWGQIAATLRAYAQQKYGRSIYLTSNGIWPLVDFQGVGLYNYNHDADGGGEAEYVPVTPGSTTTAATLNGTVSLQRPFLNLKARSAALAPGVPVVLFIDWPTDFMSEYLHMPQSQQEDYWRLYAAEAYANGLYFAFFLRDTEPGDPTATQLGLMPFFQSLTAFYKAHAALYHGVAAAPSTVTATPSLTTKVMIAVADQASPRRRLVHLVNHDYAGAPVEHDGFTVTVPLPSAPTSATLASPDLAADVTLTPSYANGAATVTVPSLVAYDVLELAY